MSRHLDSVPFSGIIRIRDMMFEVKDPYRLDQGDVSFDAPETVKEGMRRAIAENRTHYLQTTGVPRLLDLLTDKLRRRNGLPVDSPDEVMVTTGGIHALYLFCHALLEPGDEVIVPDPEWPPAMGDILTAQGVPVPCPLHESLGWGYDFDELEARITPRTRAIYVNSPHNPTGGVLGRADIERIAAIARDRRLWVISDEAYEDVVYDDAVHVSIGSLPGMYERTFSFFTLSKTFAMTGLRLGYCALRDPVLRDRMKKVLFYTAGNVTSIVQFGAIAGLEGEQGFVEEYRRELAGRRDLFFEGIRRLEGGVLSGDPPRGAFYAFLRIDPDWQREARRATGLGRGTPGDPDDRGDSLSWAMAEHLIKGGRIGCVPGVDFGANGEGYIRFCFARERRELTGALESMRALFSVQTADSRPR
jgi:aspartate aminotransferase